MNRPNRAGPPGFRALAELRGHEKLIRGIAFSPDGRWLASGAGDRMVRLWDLDTGDSRALQKHSGSVISVAFSPDGGLLASGAKDTNVVIWNPASGASLGRLSGHTGDINSLAWSPAGDKLASASDDGTVRLWRIEPASSPGRPLRVLLRHTSSVKCLAWSGDGRWLSSGGRDTVIRLWDGETGAWVRDLRGHSGAVRTLTWSPDGLLVSGSEDRSIRFWDPASGEQQRILEGPTGEISALAFSPDGSLLASRSTDHKVRLWSCGTWEPAAELPERKGLAHIPGLAFHPVLPRLAVVSEDEPLIVLWQLDLLRVPVATPAEQQVRYTTAKIVLVGDSRVGKTCLGWRLVRNEFKDQPSTHGQQFWVVDRLGGPRTDGTMCETVLWDLAGQPEYRLIHALFLEKLDLALVVFDPLQKDLQGVEYWLSQLARGGRQCSSLLVAAGIDRGSPVHEEAQIRALTGRYGVTGGSVATSAKTGEGIEELVARIRQEIPWDRLPPTTTPATFKRIKEYVLALKQETERPAVLVSPEELQTRLVARYPDWGCTDDEMMTTLRHLQTHGFVTLLQRSTGDLRILLAPDLLTQIASSLILQARQNRLGLGALDEDDLLRGGYAVPELGGFDQPESEALLDSVTKLFLDNAVCFREKVGARTLLIFPSLITQKRPAAEVSAFEEGSTYRIRGSVETVYPSLVVRLGYTNVFTRTHHWEKQAQFEAAPGEVCGFRLVDERVGEVQLVLYFGREVPQTPRLLFQALCEQFLGGRGLTVGRYPALACPTCGERQPRMAIVERVDAGKGFIHCQECGTRMELPPQPEDIFRPAAAEARLKPAQHRRLIEEQWITEARNRFESALVTIKGIARDKGAKAPVCFISYAWGDEAQARWVEKLARDLENAGVDAILDQWDNAAIGSSIVGFVERIASSDYILVVGTASYRQKYESNAANVVTAEIRLIGQRLLGTGEERRTVLPLLLQGERKEAFPPLMGDLVHADFRDSRIYFAQLFDLVLTVHGISFEHAAVTELRRSLLPGEEAAA